MSKLDDLMNIIYDYDALVSHWLEGNRACFFETGDGKSAYDFADDLREQAFKIIESLKEEYYANH